MKKLTLIFFSLFCVITSQQVLAKAAENLTENNYSLTISGGVSLGVYEAGLNWALIEWTRDHYPHYNFNTSTGASAGAINALISAIHYCSKEAGAHPIDNNFYLTWGELDLLKLLPESATRKYDQYPPNYKDGLLTRDAFRDMIQSITNAIDDNIYRPGCEINLGFTVTRSIPLPIKLNMSTPQEVKVQRFAVPLKAIVDEHGKLYFVNHINYGTQADKFRAYFFLPENKSKTIRLCPEDKCKQNINPVGFERVLQTVLASSAFPVAFGRIYMDHCVKEAVKNGNPLTLSSSESCPDKHTAVNDSFVDGGVFDNIPIGLAVELMEPNSRQAKSASNAYVFLDPDKRRDSSLEKIASGHDDPDKYDIGSQLKFLSGAVTVTRRDELYESLIKYFHNNGTRQLLLPKRYAAITGNYLMNFATFFSQAFRDYDYAAGLYDGIISIARHVLANDYINNNKGKTISSADIENYISKNIGQKTHQLYQQLLSEKHQQQLSNLDDQKKRRHEISIAIFHMLAIQEFCSNNECSSDWQWLTTKNTTEFSFYKGLYIILEQLEIGQLCQTNHTNCEDDKNNKETVYTHKRINMKRLQSVIGRYSRLELSNLKEGGVYYYYELVIALEKFKDACEDRTNDICDNETARNSILKMYNSKQYPYLAKIDNQINEIYLYYDRMLTRLSHLETVAQTGNQKWFNMANVVLSSRDLNKPYNGYPAWRPTSADEWYKHFAISADFNGNGYFLTWGRYNLLSRDTDSVLNNAKYYFQFDGIRLGNNGNDEYDSVSTGANIVWGRDDYLLSTVSVGVRWISTSDPEVPQLRQDIPTSYPAYNLNFGVFADKLRLGAEYCNECAFENGHWKIMLEINDISAIVKNFF